MFRASDIVPSLVHQPVNPATDSPNRAHLSRRRSHAFTLLELLVVLGIVGVLASILIPYVRHVRELNRRQECSNNLRQIRDAIKGYLDDNHNMMPRVRYNEATQPQGYIAFTGVDDPDPFAENSTVAPNDVTASLWLLVRTEKIKDTAVFVCPSSGDQRDPMLTAQGQRATPQQRSNFRSTHYLSYSYASPFSASPQYRLSDAQVPGFALLADRNPGIGKQSDVTRLKVDDPLQNMAYANSLNHGRAGQNVLYADGHVDFVATVFSGHRQDNIYTALSKTVVTPESKDLVNLPGYLGHDIGPAWASDSYLLPTMQDRPPKD